MACKRKIVLKVVRKPKKATIIQKISRTLPKNKIKLKQFC